MKRDAENKVYTIVTIIRMTGKKMFLYTDQSTKWVYKGQVDGGTSINSVPILASSINP